MKAGSRREATGRVVVDRVTSLTHCIVPDASPSAREALVEYSMNILGSLVGAGSRVGATVGGTGAYFAVGERMERRLRSLRRDDADVQRFTVLRAALSTLHGLTKKT